jgi:DNA invertase Pin-like site-specific DNA recombinase
MAARLWGYSRVSVSTQDWTIQLEALTKAGVDDRDVFREKASGVKRDRTELRRMLDVLKGGDSCVVFALDRLARSPLHLLQVVDEIEAKGAKLISLRESIDTGSPLGRFFITIVGSVACLERDLILSRTKAGADLARQRGVRFGRPPKLTRAMIRQVMLANEESNTTVPETCRVLGISKSSYYAALRVAQIQGLLVAVR